MNTEKIKTLEQISTALDEVSAASQDPELTTAEQATLDRTTVLLQKMQNDIILKAEQTLVEALDEPNEELKRLSGSLKQAAERLQNVADKVNKVSKTIGGLVQLIKTAASAGLI